MRSPFLAALLVLALSTAGCGDDDSGSAGRDSTDSGALACDAEPQVMTTGAGVDFVRTPDSCFADLPDWPYEPAYVDIDGLRQAYVDVGPADGPVVLLLHGQPSWSYLYRKMIPPLADAGFRVIAMDHLGMGRSDKPIDIGAYSYLGHYDRLQRFVESLDLRDINLFVQDWGSLIGLRYAGLHPERFARIAVGDGTLPVVPAGFQPFPPVEDPDEIVDLDFAFGLIPAQQAPFYDDCTLLLPGGTDFGAWMTYAMKAASFRPSEVVEALTWFDLPAEEEAAYDAPFPSRIYMAGPRVFPSLVNELPGRNDVAWAGLTSFTRPFLTLWASNDPGNLGQCATQQMLIDSIPGAAGLPHDRLAEASHFLQDDQGEEIARRLAGFFSFRPLGRGDRYCEILLVESTSAGLEAEVWGTQTINDCPQASWEALDADAIRTEAGALAVVLNGPRLWLPNATVGTLDTNVRRLFGDLEMRLFATVEVDPSQASTPYMPTVVRRTTTYLFERGEEIYELTSPEGAVFVMQSLSQIVDPSLTLADLASLGSRLTLPAGWTYAARTLAADLLLTVGGEAVVLQDDLGNTYQRATTSSPSPPTPTPATDPPLPVLDDGTGRLCSSDEACAGGLAASHCLLVDGVGFCTVEGCEARGCGAPYVCCSGCSAAAAPFLPFSGSACLPAGQTDRLTDIAGCSCQPGSRAPTATATATGTPEVVPTPTPTPPCASSPECDSPHDDERLGFEILEVQSPESIRAWISPNITRAQFDALELPPGWIKNQPREGDPDASRFHRSPGATVDGEFLDAELFGFEWRHSATVIRAGFALDEAGLLIGSTVVKSHEVTFEAGRTVYVLVSPDDEAYFRIGRDADRTSDVPTLPDTWRLVEYVTPERLVIQLPDEVLVIRTGNQDSFQGPVPELAVAF